MGVECCGTAALAASWCINAAETKTAASLTDALAVIQAHRFVDLTHAFAPGIPHWKGAPTNASKPCTPLQRTAFESTSIANIGQWGTHVDPPAHFHDGLHTVDQIDPKDMLMPLVVIDVHDKAAKNPDYVLSVDDIHSWSAPRPDTARRLRRHAHRLVQALAGRQSAGQQRRGGVFHYPGWRHAGAEAAVRGARHHRLRPRDHGHRSGRCHHQRRLFAGVLHSRTNHYQIELLANLDQVPEAGGLVWITFPKVEKRLRFPGPRDCGGA